jgi:FkbM family methyltransferase
MRVVEGAVFWDFGAHFGIHTVGMAIRVGPKGQVASFEPDPVAYSRLLRHISMNKLENVVAFQAAVSTTDGKLPLYFPRGHGRGSSCSHFQYYPENDMSDIPSLPVRTMVPDALVASGVLRVPNLIKIDVQGHGAQAIAGSIESIKSARPLIAFSSHSDAELSGTQALLEPLGYAPVDFRGVKIAWADVHEAVLLPSTAS